MTLSCQEKFVSDDINKEYENGGEEVDIETDDDSYTITATESKKKKKKSSRAVGSSSHKFHQLIHYYVLVYLAMVSSTLTNHAKYMVWSDPQ